MKPSIVRLLAIGCALCVTMPSFVLGAEGAGKQERRGGRFGGAGEFLEKALGKLDLKEDQKTKIEAIREKYRGEMQAFMQAHGEEIKAAREAGNPEKMRELMQPMREKIEKQIDEIKNVLNEEQKAQLQQAIDAARAAGPGGKAGGKRGPGKE